MTLLARLSARLFGTSVVDVFLQGSDSAMLADEDVVWHWHFRGVLHCVTLWYGGKYDPRWTTCHYKFPLSSIDYWTVSRL